MVRSEATEDVDVGVIQQVAQELLTSIAIGDETTPVDKELLDTAENLILAHQFYVQLSFVDLIIKRVKKLGIYFDTMDAFTEELYAEDMAEMAPQEKVRGVQALTNATRVQLETVNSMLASREASNTLISTLRENFAGSQSPKESEDTGALLDKIKQMTPDKRQRVLRGAVQALKTFAQKELENDD